jgi:protein O-mannosyl-transferase
MSVAGAFFIAGLAIAIYLPAMSGQFIMDDDALLFESPLVRAPDGWLRFWSLAEPIDFTPIAYDSLWFEWRLWNMSPVGYRITNLALHIASALMIWLILRRLAVPGAYLAALLFVVHPVNVESVAWIAQRRNVLALFFALLSVWWYLKFAAADDLDSVPDASDPADRDPVAEVSDPGIEPASLWPAPPRPGTARHHRAYWLSLSAFALALGSKGSVAILPVVLLGMIAWRRPLKRQDWVRVAPYFVLAAVLTAVNIWTQHIGETIRTASISERLAGAGAVVWFYLAKALAPIDLVFVYPQWSIDTADPRWWWPLVALVLAAALVVWRRASVWPRALLFAGGFFCVALLPVMGLTDVGFMRYSLVANHYLHIAIIGVVALVAAAWSAWRERSAGLARWIAAGVAATLVAVLALVTRHQTALFGNPILLYQETLEKNPSSWLIQNHLGLQLYLSGQLPAAIDWYQQALRIKPDYAFAHSNLGAALAKSGRLPEAIEHLREAVRLKPDSFKAYRNLGNALFSAGQIEQAIEPYKQAEILEPYNPEIAGLLVKLGTALAMTGQPASALDRLERAAALDGDNVECWATLAPVYAQLRDAPQAIAAAQRALALAQAQGDTAKAGQIKAWLDSYRAGH